MKLELMKIVINCVYILDFEPRIQETRTGEQETEKNNWNTSWKSPTQELGPRIQETRIG